MVSSYLSDRIYINDLALLLKKCKFLFFADDLKMFRSVSSKADADILQENINTLNSWSSKSLLIELKPYVSLIIESMTFCCNTYRL